MSYTTTPIMIKLGSLIGNLKIIGSPPEYTKILHKVNLINIISNLNHKTYHDIQPYKWYKKNLTKPLVYTLVWPSSWNHKSKNHIYHLSPIQATKKHQKIIHNIHISSPWAIEKYQMINHNIHRFSTSNWKVSQNKSQYPSFLNEQPESIPKQ